MLLDTITTGIHYENIINSYQDIRGQLFLCKLETMEYKTFGQEQK